MRTKKKHFINQYTGERLIAIAIVLSLFVLFSGTVVAGMLGVFKEDEPQTIINLIPEDASVSAELLRADSDMIGIAENEPIVLYASADGKLHNIPSLAVNTVQPAAQVPFNIIDSKQIWTNDTKIELFKTAYSGNGGLTVQSADGDKVIAPGTHNYYTFAVQNNSNMTMDYQIIVETYLSEKIAGIPVLTKLDNNTGNYVVGGKNLWINVMEMNGMTDTGTLSAGNQNVYALGWMWPFESGIDMYDTALGVMAQGDDLELTIVIKTVCTANTIPGAAGGIPPQTGDNMNIMFWFILAIVSFFTMMFLLLWKGRSEGDSNEEKPQKI